MRLLRKIFGFICAIVVLAGLGVAVLAIRLSSTQDTTDKDLRLAQGACPGGTVHEHAIAGPNGEIESFGGGKVAFDIAPNSALRTAGVNLTTTQDGQVVKAAAIYADAEGKTQINAAEGTDVTSVRVGQLGRGTTVVRADACVGEANFFGKIAHVAHVLGVITGVFIILFMFFVFSAGYLLCGALNRRRERRRKREEEKTEPTVAPTTV